ncbi:MAG: hypothetical protein H8D35_00890 [Nitrosopumilus sp.]|nr:hypothetical protein [Nitrosopumilus sp.]
MNQKSFDNKKFVKKLDGLNSVVDSMDDLFKYQLDMTRVFKRYLSHTRCQIHGFYRLLGMCNDQHVEDYRKFTINKVTKQNKKKRRMKND